MASTPHCTDTELTLENLEYHVFTIHPAPIHHRAAWGDTASVAAILLPNRLGRRLVERANAAGCDWFSASSCSMNPPRPWGKKPRGDKTAIELFLAGVRGWEASLRRLDDAVGPRVRCVTTGNSKGLQ